MCMIPVVVVCLAALFDSPRVGVGQAVDEDPLPSVGCADFRRRKESERAAEIARSQVPKDLIEAERDMAGDVFEEDFSRSKSVDEVEDGRPEMTRVVSSQPSAGRGERLTRVASGDEVDRREVGHGEVSEIAEPYRRRIQPPFFHRLDQDAGGEGFPLHHADWERRSAHSSEAGVETEVESADPRAERED